MKFYSIADIEKIMNDGGYRHVGLVNSNKEWIIPINQPGLDHLTERFNDVKKRLNSNGLEDGIYSVCLSFNNRKNCKFDYFNVKVGEIDTNKPMMSEKVIVEKLPDVRSYNKALDDQILIKQLELDNQSLRDKIADLEETISELENELEEKETLSEENEQPTMIESAKSFLTQLMEFGTPLLDKHFALREQQLNLEARKLLMNKEFNQREARQPQQEPKPNIDEKIQNFIRQFEEDEETFNEIASIYNSATDINDFFNKLNSYNSEIYGQLRQTI